MHDSTCSIDGCEMRVKWSGWCQTHYRRHLKYGDPLWKPQCAECGAKFNRTHNRQKFCSPECYRRKEWKRLGLMVDPLTLECANDECSKVFTQTRQYQKYCSQGCANRGAYVAVMADPDRADDRRNYARKWSEGNPWHRTVTNTRRRALLNQAFTIPFTAQDLQSRFIANAGRCWICGLGAPDSWDHVKPLAKGGAHMLANLRPACKRCNSSKGAKWGSLRAA